jgi:hypothetical protein
MNNESGGPVNTTVRCPMRIPGRYIVGISMAPLVIPVFFAFYDGMDPVVINISLLLSYSGMIIFGIPIILYLSKIQRLKLILICVLGAVTGCLVWFTFLVGYANVMGTVTTYEIPELLYSALIGVSMGFVVALVFGLVAGIPILYR